MCQSSRLGLIVGFFVFGGGVLPGCSGESVESRPTAELNKPVDVPKKPAINSMDVMARQIEKGRAKAGNK